MARLGLDINLALQRLLAGNKERAAANRGALEDRKRTKENAAEKAQLAADAATRPGSPTQNEEPRGGTPDLYRPPEPAAQRRKKGLQVFGVDRLSARPEFGSEVYYSQSWTRSVAQYQYKESYPFGTNDVAVREFASPVTYGTNTEVNYYSKETTEWGPEFNQELSNSRKFWIAPKYSVQDRITEFQWTYRQEADVYFANGFEVNAGLTPPPFLLSDAKSARTFDAYVSSDGTYIYVTHLVGVFKPGYAVTSGTVYGVNTAEDPDSWLEGARDERSIGIGGSGSSAYRRYNVATGERFFTRGFWPYYDKFYIVRDGEWFDISFEFDSTWPDELEDVQYSIDTWYGLYWRFNVRQPATPEFRSEIVHFQVSNYMTQNTDGEAPKGLFNGMYPSDPIYRLFQAQAAGYTVLPTSMLIEQFLRNSDGFYKRWPTGLVYDEQRGYLTFVTTLAGWDTPRMFTKQVGQITYGYANIPIIELPSNFNAFLTTEQQMLDRGWVNEGLIPQNTLDSLEQYFAFKQ
jgi:hypothetical protein